MSRRIQCNTLSVKPKADGTCGNIECETLQCKSITCENFPSTTVSESLPKDVDINIPYTLQVCHISLGMMGTSEDDSSHQVVYTPCDFSAQKLVISWHDWSPGYPEETIYFNINNGEWQSVVLKESQTIVPLADEYTSNDQITSRVYTQVGGDNEPTIQSLSMNLFGVHKCTITV